MNIPLDWAHFISMDYHESVDNAIVFCSLSPNDECFLWDGLSINPKTNTTEEIAERILGVIGNQKKFKLALIDPLANKTQTNTGTTVVDDLNEYFRIFKSDGLCQRVFWETFDTKGLRGRDKIRVRLSNATKVKRPFNNSVNGINVPTLWTDVNNREINKAFYKWRIEKGKPSQKWSHYMTALEGLMKDSRFRPIIKMNEDDLYIRKRMPKSNLAMEYFKSR